MGNHYNQLSFKDRVQLQTLSELGLSARKIATKMGRSKKTVASELKRCHKGIARQLTWPIQRQLACPVEVRF